VTLTALRLRLAVAPSNARRGLPGEPVPEDFEFVDIFLGCRLGCRTRRSICQRGRPAWARLRGGEGPWRARGDCLAKLHGWGLLGVGIPKMHCSRLIENTISGQVARTTEELQTRPLALSLPLRRPSSAEHKTENPNHTRLGLQSRGNHSRLESKETNTTIAAPPGSRW